MYSNKFLLVISKNYWGANNSEETALNFSNKFSRLMNISPENITHLIGNSVTLSCVKETISNYIIKSMSKNLFQPIFYIYINGHGNQTYDSNGDEIKSELFPSETYIDSMDELYQLPDGNLIDDELTKLMDESVYYGITNNGNCMDRPLIILISDHCSSGSMIDKTSMYFDWISFGSSLDNQDSYITGDGNVMTINLLQILENNEADIHKMSTLEMFTLLKRHMKESFIGEIQIPTLHISNDKMLDIYPF